MTATTISYKGHTIRLIKDNGAYCYDIDGTPCQTVFRTKTQAVESAKYKINGHVLR